MDRLIAYYLQAQNVLRNQKGQGMVEYGLIIGLVAVLLILSLTNLRTAIEATFQAIIDAL